MGCEDQLCDPDSGVKRVGGEHSADAPYWARAAVTTQLKRLTKERRGKIRERQRDHRHLNKQEAEKQPGSKGSTTPRCEEQDFFFVQSAASELFDCGTHL